MEWQPIESAPPPPVDILHGADVLMLVAGGTLESELDEGGEPMTEAVKVSRYSDKGYSVCDTVYYSAYVRNPTHWMPLPAPPEA